MKRKALSVIPPDWLLSKPKDPELLFAPDWFIFPIKVFPAVLVMDENQIPGSP